MNYSPVIAFAESRINTLRRQLSRKEEGDLTRVLEIARIDELTGIVTLCKWLEQTDDILRKQLGLVETI